MAEVTLNDPHLVETKTVDNRGRVYVDNSLKGQDVKIAVEVVDNG